MYNFILNQWIMKKITAEKVQSYVPRWITQEQCDAILATPQMSAAELAAIDQLSVD
jgi:hypothetical protein